MRVRAALVSAVASILIALTRDRVDAIPAYSRVTGVQCDACHSAVRTTNDLGDYFRRSGYRMPNLGHHGTPVVTVLGSAGYDNGTPGVSPSVEFADKIYAFLTARITQNVVVGGEYYYARDGRFTIETNQAWLQYTTHGNVAGAPLRLMIGSPSLPLPVDTDAYRPSLARYAIFDQTVGSNPFSLSSQRNALTLGIGSQVRGPSVTIALAQSTDPRSTLAADGLDRMLEAHESSGNFMIGGYTYAGTRPLGPVPDAFVRHAFTAGYFAGRLALETLVQTGDDSSATGTGLGRAASGGYAQLRLLLGGGNSAIARYEGTSQSLPGTFQRLLVLGAERPIAKGVTLQIEDTIRNAPRTSHSLGLAIGYGISTTRIGSTSY
jgi:hypothetical protein